VAPDTFGFLSKTREAKGLGALSETRGEFPEPFVGFTGRQTDRACVPRIGSPGASNPDEHLRRGDVCSVRPRE
jgi:hypothetical protein